MSLAIAKNFHTSDTSDTSCTTSQVLNNHEFEDYLLYESISGADRDTSTIIANAVKEITNNDIAVPARSPRRPRNATAAMPMMNPKLNISDSPCSILDSSSFEYHDGSVKSSTESIFSTDDYMNNHEDESKLDEFGLDLEGIDDMDLFLNEIDINEMGESSIVFQIDDVITIVALH